jgi:hypothetical protein
MASRSAPGVNRIWRDQGLQPHRVETFKLSNDPRFLEKLTDVLACTSIRPDNALALCVDEKRQIQALGRTQPGLPMKPGRAGTMTHDYKRQGTTTLFAAHGDARGTRYWSVPSPAQAPRILRFLKRLDREFPKHLDLHLILDNNATHKHLEVKRLAGYPDPAFICTSRHPRRHGQPGRVLVQHAHHQAPKSWFLRQHSRPPRRDSRIHPGQQQERRTLRVATASVKSILEKLERSSYLSDGPPAHHQVTCHQGGFVLSGRVSL